MLAKVYENNGNNKAKNAHFSRFVADINNRCSYISEKCIWLPADIPLFNTGCVALFNVR